MTTFTLTTPVTVGDLNNPRTVTALAITSVWYTSTPDLALGGTGELDITLTETTTGWQETITYRDSSMLDMWNAVVTAPAGQTLGDTIAQAIFAKLIADSKLPAGTLSTTVTATT
jgi:hypothetical protein